MTNSESVLLVRDLTKEYRQGETRIEVLKGLNLDVKKGQSVAVLGPSGSGKSTFLSLLAGLDRPSAGSIQLHGTSLGELDERAMTLFRGKHIGIVFQQFHLLPHLTALENVMLPLELQNRPLAEAKKSASELLNRVGLSARTHHLPHQLSGGECQRVAVARAIVTSPALLLADEPSGNLDGDTGREVLDLLFTLMSERGMTSIVVTHSEELAKRCDRQELLGGGILRPRHSARVSNAQV